MRYKEYVYNDDPFESRERRAIDAAFSVFMQTALNLLTLLFTS